MLFCCNFVKAAAASFNLSDSSMKALALACVDSIPIWAKGSFLAITLIVLSILSKDAFRSSIAEENFEASLPVSLNILTNNVVNPTTTPITFKIPDIPANKVFNPTIAIAEPALIAVKKAPTALSCFAPYAAAISLVAILIANRGPNCAFSTALDTICILFADFLAASSILSYIAAKEKYPVLTPLYSDLALFNSLLEFVKSSTAGLSLDIPANSSFIAVALAAVTPLVISASKAFCLVDACDNRVVAFSVVGVLTKAVTPFDRLVRLFIPSKVLKAFECLIAAAEASLKAIACLDISFCISPALYVSYNFLVSVAWASTAILESNSSFLQAPIAGIACLSSVEAIAPKAKTKAEGCSANRRITGPRKLLAISRPAVVTFFKLANS